MENTVKTKSGSKRLKSASFGPLGFWMLILVVFSSLIQCANIQQPTGGPKDTIPPVLVKETPKNLSTNFNQRKIVLEFDEFIRLENQQREVSISPEMDEMPTFQIRRKELHIELPDTLEENTTYTINFGNAIADNNERNPFRNYVYVFSTGDEIDSLSVSGKVTNALTNLPEKQISVLLIPTRQDSIFGKQKANIFTTTDSSGTFRFNYLREDQYRIYALREQNNDRIYNAPLEALGFLSDSINLTKDTAGILLRTSIARPTDFRVMNRGLDKSGRLFFKFNRGLESPHIRITHPESLDESKYVEFNSLRDSVNLWVEDLTFDSLKLQFWDRDTVLLDSLTFRRPRNDKYDRNILIVDNLERNKVDLVKHIELTANAPIQAVDRSKIILNEDSTARTNYQMLRDSLDNKKIIIRYNWRPKAEYNLTIESGAIQGFFGETNQNMAMTFTLDENDKYGDITLNITVPDTNIHYIVMLLDEKKVNTLREDRITGNTKINYRKFLEGNYHVRIIYDANQNGLWDPGELSTGVQPEYTWELNKTIIIRPNWEQEENVQIPPLPGS